MLRILRVITFGAECLLKSGQTDHTFERTTGLRAASYRYFSWDNFDE
jgi:hypothetical protein